MRGAVSTSVWMPAEFGAPLLEVDFTHTGFYNELLDRAGEVLMGERKQIRAAVPDAEDSALLGLIPDVAALAIGRLGCAKDRPVECCHTLVRRRSLQCGG
jgi:GntR family transcriptional regulator